MIARMGALSADSLEDLFPTHGAIEERQQIGRAPTIRALVERIADHGDSLLLEPRKQGKSSVARAAIDRVVASGGTVAEGDCTAAGVHDGPSLARALLQSVRDRGGRVSRLIEAREVAARQTPRLARLRRDAAAAEGLGVAEAGAIAHVLDLLGGPADVPLVDVLDGLARLGETQTVALFLDEVQAVAGWADSGDVQRVLAQFMRRAGRRVAVLAAGSDRSATELLFAEGMPLHWDFEAFPLPPIDRVDWHRGLAERFAAAGHRIDSRGIDQILDATGGHPQRTMAVAKQAAREARDARERDVSWGAVDAAVTLARRHPSWST
jgi:hypothetical protein